MPYLRLLRPEQWSKNLFLFAGLVFGQKLTDAESLVRVLLAFVCFSLVSSTVYILNDAHDRRDDRLHPRKKHRPIAAGLITVQAALVIAACLLIGSLTGSFLLERRFFLVALIYFAMQLAYTFSLKQVVILDVIVIGVGFVLRAVAGAVVIDVETSPWLVLCTFTLCLFMGFSKRRCELNALADHKQTDVARHRKTLIAYTPDLLNHMTTLTAGIAVVSFVLYATDDRTIAVYGEHGSHYLLYTLPMVVYAIFRFALLVEHGRVDGPTAVLTRDFPFQAAIALWVIAVVVIIYAGEDVQSWLNWFAGDGARQAASG